jgi:hypothetical protein
MRVMVTQSELTERLQEIERALEEIKKPPRTSAEKFFAAGADFVLAIAFFALGITANIIAAEVDPAIGSLIFTLIGVVTIKLWGLRREWEHGEDELHAEARDKKLAMVIVRLTIDELDRRAAVGSQSDKLPSG